MTTNLTALISVLEEENLVGDELRRNLEAQKQAILAWNLVNLLQQVEAREPLLLALKDLERRRCVMIAAIASADEPPTLSRLVARAPLNTPEHAQLRALLERTRRIFMGLSADEQNLHALMENLCAHIQYALSPFGGSSAPLYGESGVAVPRRPFSALIESKV